MMRAASLSWSGLGTIGETGAGFHSSTSSRSTPASGGISISTGRGRPLRICLKASVTAAGTSRGLDAARCHLVTVRTVPAWSSTSCTAPMFLPIAARDTCPAMTSTGEERAYAVAMPDAAL